MDFVLDPCTMQYIDNEVIESIRIYPVSAELKLTSVKLVPWYGCEFLYNGGEGGTITIENLSDRLKGTFTLTGCMPGNFV